MHDALGEPERAEAYRRVATQLRASVARAFLRKHSDAEGMLISATGLGRKDDVWGSAFAVAEGILPEEAEVAVCKGLLSLYKGGGIVADGQVRALPPSGPFGGYWEQSGSPDGHYQNGGYWGTMSGWLAVALHRVDPPAALGILHDLVASISAHRRDGAPWEWISPSLNLCRNPLYCATVALPYVTLRRSGFTGRFN
jgi:hypothetical protein